MPGKTVAPNLYQFGPDIKQWAAKSLEAESQERFVVVGCSAGGSCALVAMNLAPDRVAAVILIGTKARCDPNPDELLEVCQTIAGQGWQKHGRVISEVDGHHLVVDEGQ